MVAAIEAQLPNGAVGLQLASHASNSHGDCIFQVQSELIAYRMILYHKNDETRYRVYPNGGAEEIIHLKRFPHVHNRDSELVLFKNLAVPKSEFKSWFDQSFMRFSVNRAYFLDGLEATSREDLLDQLLKMEVPPKTDLFRVSAYPKELEKHIIYKIFEDHLLDKGWDIHPLEYTKVLFAVTISPTCIRYSLRPREELFLTPSDGPTRVEGQLCKAAGKLTEALFVSGFEPKKGGVAIDVGASPGGWTQVLAQTMDTVVAVDPAELHPDVLALPNVVHIKQQSQAATEEIIAAVGQDKTIDLLVCDINRHPDSMAIILKPLFSILRSGGMIILTMKYRGKGKEKAHGVEKLINDLGAEFKEVKYLWLLANTENERTAVALKV